MTPRFTGHDTFPLRYGWLYKAVNSLIYEDNNIPREDLVGEAIVTLGVGRNMVNAIRYWAEMSGVLIPPLESKTRGALTTSQIGNFLFNEDGGIDPYLEDIASIWLVHYLLNTKNDLLTSYRYFFNYSNFQSFEKQRLTDELIENCISLTGREAGRESTVKRDVDCFLHTYIKKNNSKNAINEDYFSSPLSELGLITESVSGYYISELSDRQSLTTEIFAYALCDFIRNETIESGVNTIDFDSLLSKPGSPGKIFRLSEQGLSHKLDEASLLSEGHISWIDSLGLRQIQISEKVKNNPDFYLKMHYGSTYAC